MISVCTANWTYELSGFDLADGLAKRLLGLHTGTEFFTRLSKWHFTTQDWETEFGKLEDFIPCECFVEWISVRIVFLLSRQIGARTPLVQGYQAAAFTRTIREDFLLHLLEDKVVHRMSKQKG